MLFQGIIKEFEDFEKSRLLHKRGIYHLSFSSYFTLSRSKHEPLALMNGTGCC